MDTAIRKRHAALGGTMRTTHYTILDISPTAELDEVYIAHRKAHAALNHAANMGDPEAQGQMRLVDLAYETLSDPARRAAYDTSLAAEQTQIMSAVEVEPVTRHPYLRMLLLGLLLAVMVFFWQEKAAERQARAAAEFAQKAANGGQNPARVPVVSPTEAGAASDKPARPKTDK
jgi:curved DNA-binding protein CbpA